MVDRKFWKNKKVLITGHTGFKGGWLSFILKDLGCRLYGLSLRPDKLSFFNQTKANENFILSTYLDINDYKKLERYLKKINPQIIFHLAAQPLVLDSYTDPIKTFKTNIMGTANLLNVSKLIKSLRAILVITSDKCYENEDRSIRFFKESDKLGGYDPYSASKASAEHISHSMYNSFLKEKKIQLATVRAGNVIGGGDYSKFRIVPDIFRSIKNNQTLMIRNPNSIRPWQHVLEPLIGYIKIVEKIFFNEKFASAWNFGPERDNIQSVKKIVLEICKIKKFNYKIKKSSINKKESKYLGLDISKIKKNKIWKPKLNFYKTLKLTLDWYMSSNKKKLTQLQIKEYLNGNY